MKILQEWKIHFFNNQRKRKWIDSMSQACIGLEVLVHSFLLWGFFAFICYVEPLVKYSTRYTVIEHQRALEYLLAINLSKWPLFILALALTFLFIALFSHRVVGPIYKLKSTFKKFNARDFSSEFHLRRFDYFQGIVMPVEEFRINTREDIRLIKNEIDALKASSHDDITNERLARISRVVDAYILNDSRK